MNVIASYRAEGFFKYLKKFGYNPTLITHNWGNIEASKTEYIEKKEGTIVSVPLKKYLIVSIIKKIETIKGLNKISIIIRWLFGFLDDDPDQMNSYYSLKSELPYIFKNQKYDLILGISTPIHHVRTCHLLSKRFGLMNVLDFRDLYDNRVLSDYKIPVTYKIKNAITVFFLKKWSKKTIFTTLPGEEWAKFLEKKLNKPSFEILNGFESDILSSFKNKASNKHFTITSSGTLQPTQKLEVFFKGLHMFIADNPEASLKVNFVGVRKSGYRVGQWSEIEKSVPAEYLNIMPRISKEDNINLLLDSHVLLFPITVGYHGYYTGKIFEYLGAARHILAFPRWGTTIPNLLEETEAGVTLNTPQEINDHLTKMYELWSSGELRYSGLKNKIDFYTREAQTKRLANKLNNFFYE